MPEENKKDICKKETLIRSSPSFLLFLSRPTRLALWVFLLLFVSFPCGNNDSQRNESTAHPFWLPAVSASRAWRCHLSYISFSPSQHPYQKQTDGLLWPSGEQHLTRGHGPFTRRTEGPAGVSSPCTSCAQVWSVTSPKGRTSLHSQLSESQG